MGILTHAHILDVLCTIHRVRAGGGLTRGRHTWRQEENEGGKGRAVAKDRFVSVEFSLLFCSLVSLFSTEYKNQYLKGVKTCYKV